MNQTLDPVFAAAVRRELTALPSATPASSRRRIGVMLATALGAVTLGGVAIASLPPAGEVASPPLAPPLILNGVGPVTLSAPPAPDDAAYLRIELTCFDGTRCNTPGGGIEGPAGPIPKVQRDALPVTEVGDPDNAQALDRVDPEQGFFIDVDPETHWRLYAVYTDDLNPEPAPVGDTRTLGIPSNAIIPDLVPAVGTNGKPGWIEYELLTHRANPRFTADGVQQEPLPLYDTDGTTVIGKADVSQTHR